MLHIKMHSPDALATRLAQLYPKEGGKERGKASSTNLLSP